MSSHHDKSSSSSKKSSGNSNSSRSTRGPSMSSSGQSSSRHSTRKDDFWSIVLPGPSRGTPLTPPTVGNPGSRGSSGRGTPRPHPERQFSCDLCKNGFERKGHLDAHIETVHEGKRPHICPYGCGKAFGHRSSLSRHIRSSHEDQALPPLPNPKRKQSSSK